MATSVLKYGGFWVGRFQSSSDETGTKALSVIGGNAEFMPCSEDWKNCWYGQYDAQRILSSSYSTSMIWGCQFYQICWWLFENGVDVTSYPPKDVCSGNPTRSGHYTDYSNYALYPTGSSEDDKLGNIYDLLGCTSEYSLMRVY